MGSIESYVIYKLKTSTKRLLEKVTLFCPFCLLTTITVYFSLFGQM